MHNAGINALTANVAMFPTNVHEKDITMGPGVCDALIRDINEVLDNEDHTFVYVNTIHSNRTYEGGPARHTFGCP